MKRAGVKMTCTRHGVFTFYYLEIETTSYQGVRIRVPKELHIRGIVETLDRKEKQDRKSGSHLWFVRISFKFSPKMSRSASGKVVIVVKTPHQRIADHRFDVDTQWTTAQLKELISTSYPSKPVSACCLS